jgi:hypothetical protein
MGPRLKRGKRDGPTQRDPGTSRQQVVARLSGRWQRRGDTVQYSSQVGGGPGKTRRSDFRVQDHCTRDCTLKASRKLRPPASASDSPEHNKVRHSGNSPRHTTPINRDYESCEALPRDIIKGSSVHRVIQAAGGSTIRSCATHSIRRLPGFLTHCPSADYKNCFCFWQHSAHHSRKTPLQHILDFQIVCKTIKFCLLISNIFLTG